MLITEKSLTHWLESFYGYGSWRARFWFVGYEEGGGDLPEEVAEKFNYFQNSHPTTEATLCDIRQLYRHVAIRWEGPKVGMFANRFEYRFGRDAIQNNVWKNLIAFVHGYLKTELPDFLEYQKQKFAQPPAQLEAWIPLYPLPSPHNHAWYYSWLNLPLLTFLKSRKLYEEHLYESRIQTILSNIRTYKPEVVLMYGMNNINTLKQAVSEYFSGSDFALNKAIKRQIPQHHTTQFNGTTLIITTQIPALRHGRIETGFDWEEFGRRASERI
jgi:hypothetical protein